MQATQFLSTERTEIVKGLERMLQSTRIDDVSICRRRSVKYRLWQPGFYDFNVYNEVKLLEKLDYIHSNPVRAGLVLSPSDYRWSSCKEYFEEKRQTQLRQYVGCSTLCKGDEYAQA
jgi:hypothetical protein